MKITVSQLAQDAGVTTDEARSLLTFLKGAGGVTEAGTVSKTAGTKGAAAKVYEVDLDHVRKALFETLKNMERRNG